MLHYKPCSTVHDKANVLRNFLRMRPVDFRSRIFSVPVHSA